MVLIELPRGIDMREGDVSRGVLCRAYSLRLGVRNSRHFTRFASRMPRLPRDRLPIGVLIDWVVDREARLVGPKRFIVTVAAGIPCS
jgi:hypothetical protein